MTFINFDSSIYDDTVSGMQYAKYCNKKYKPSAYDHSFDDSINENDVWFVKSDYLNEFFYKIKNNSFKITIVTQHSDYELDDIFLSERPKCVKTIFGPNATSINKSVVKIPLGLGPPYCNLTPKVEDIKLLNTFQTRTKLLYTNFRTNTYPLERKPLLDYCLNLKNFSITIANYDFLNSDEKIKNYLHDLIQHKFTLCPRGNGIDTHRLWEALYCRTIPIVKYEYAYSNFKDLPILFVNDWTEITEDYLQNKYEEMMKQHWDYSKLKASWWGKIFKD
jgi:hypothetical protein